jgi:YfiH family protein
MDATILLAVTGMIRINILDNAVNKRIIMNTNKINEVEYLTFPSFEKFDFLYHGFSTRIGGISDGIYSTMNLTFSTGDDRDRIIENYRIFCSAIGIEAESLVFGDQTHTCNVISVGAEDRGKGIFKTKTWHDVDGLITDSLGTSLVTLYADCVPLFFVDPVNKVVATSHAGWRGTVGGIAAKTVAEMKRLYNSNPEDIYAAIGPSIGFCCFETDESVAKEFLALPSEIIDNCITAKIYEYENTNNGKTVNNCENTNNSKIVNNCEITNNSETANNGKSKSNSENKNYFENTNIGDNIINVDNINTTNKYYINLQNINRNFMIAEGIPQNQIEIADICTKCNHEWLFSHRATNGRRGGMAGVIGIRTEAGKRK